MTINTLAADLVMDRTTLGRNILPLERDGLITVAKGSRDRRSRELRLTKAGAARFRTATKGWTQAQGQFAAAFRAGRTVDLRASFTPSRRPTSALPAQAQRGNPRPG
jgi:DNA-binding MarR family transcriptional regulator